MILVTGGTGFIGSALIRTLVASGYPVRILVRPSARTPNIPRGMPVEVAVSSLSEPRSLRAAMLNIDAVYHLVSIERKGAYGDLLAVDIQGTRAVAEAAAEVGVGRLFYLSHLGADRASAYPVLKAKAIAEEYIRRSKVDYTIMRTAIAFGPGDRFTTSIAQLAAFLPWIFIVPGDGATQLQPIWVEDLVTSLVWALDDETTRNETLEVGGPEYLSFVQIVEMITSVLKISRRVVRIAPPYLRGATVLFEALLPWLPISVYWLDYLAVNRTCALDTLPRLFRLMPARMSQRLEYLNGQNWSGQFLRRLFRSR
jgi:NADH dehydrogenase